MMKSSLRSDEIQGLCPWMKSNPKSCNAGLHRESDFIHTSGFNPSRTDLIVLCTKCISLDSLHIAGESAKEDFKGQVTFFDSAGEGCLNKFKGGGVLVLAHIDVVNFHTL